jgi:hypothetical protein
LIVRAQVSAGQGQVEPGRLRGFVFGGAQPRASAWLLVPRLVC